MHTLISVANEVGNIIGYIKYDGLRKFNQWTALNDNGRITDVKSVTEALDLVRGQA